METIYNEFIGQYKNALDKTTCQELIGLFEDNLILQYEENNQFKHQLSLNTSSVNEWPSFREEIKFVMQEALEDYTKRYELNLPIMDYLLDHSMDGKIQKTGGRFEGYYSWHHERDARPGNEAYNRRLAWMVYLNDNFKGGWTEFKYINDNSFDYQMMSIQPETGKLVIFPADFTHTHRANPYINGTKYIITGWCYDEQ